MAFNINDIRTGLGRGGARPTLFEVQITNPIDASADPVTPFLVRSTALPASTINPIEIPYFGRKIRIAGDRTFDAWPVTVMNDEDFAIRHTLERWHNSINSLQSNLNQNGSSAPRLYKSTAIVTQFSKTGQALRRYRFNGIFPTVIEPIELDWENTDAIELFGVTFAYDFFDVIGGTTGTVQ